MKNKVRYRKVKEYGVTHFCVPVRRYSSPKKLYKPICIPNGDVYACIQDEDGIITCKKCIKTIRISS